MGRVGQQADFSPMPEAGVVGRVPFLTLRLMLLLTLVGGALTTATAVAAPPTVRLFQVPNEPLSIASGSDGNLWLTGLNGSLTRITPWGAAIKVVDADPELREPLAITPGPDGDVWFTEFAGNRVSHLPGLADGGVRQVTLPTANSQPGGIVAGADGNLWVTQQGADRIARVTPAGVVTEFSAGMPAGGQPGDIAAGPDGNLWFLLPGTAQVGRITPTGTVTLFAAPGSDLAAITAGPDGNLWFTEPLTNKVARITPAGAVTEFTAGITPGAEPGAITAGADGNVWFIERGTGSIARITPAGVVTEFPTGLPADQLQDLRTGPDGNLWFTAANGRVGRMTTEAAPPRFTDAARILVPGTGTSGPADAYPATIQAEGLQGTVTKVTVRLNGVHHAFASDMLVQLVGPQGQAAVLMANATSRATDTTTTPPDVLDGEVLTFADGAPQPGRRLTSGVFAPFDPGFALSFAPPALPAPPASLGVFNGTNPNGAWKLFVFDDEGSPDTTGVIAGGWSLDIQTSGPPPVQLPAPAPVAVPGPPVPVPFPVAVPVPVPVPAASAPPADTKRPSLKITGLPKRASLSSLRKGFKVRIRPNEPITLDATLRAKVRRATIARVSFPFALFERTTKVSTKGKTLRIKPDRKQLGSPKRSFKVRVRLVATDAAGNRRTVQRTVTIRRPSTKKK